MWLWGKLHVNNETIMAGGFCFTRPQYFNKRVEVWTATSRHYAIRQVKLCDGWNKTKLFVENVARIVNFLVVFRSRNFLHITISCGYGGVWEMGITFVYFMVFKLLAATEQRIKTNAASPRPVRCAVSTIICRSFNMQMVLWTSSPRSTWQKETL